MLDNAGSEKNPVSLSKSNLYWEIVNCVNIMTRFIDHKKKFQKEVKHVGKYKYKILYPQYRSILVKSRDNNDSHLPKSSGKIFFWICCIVFICFNEGSQKMMKIAFYTAWKVSKYGVICDPYFPVFGLNTGNYGPEITPYLDTFHAVIGFGFCSLVRLTN